MAVAVPTSSTDDVNFPCSAVDRASLPADFDVQSQVPRLVKPVTQCVGETPRGFCLEVFAKHAQFTAAVRRALPCSFGVGYGCSATSRAPIVHADLLSPAGLALCASWAREELCLWVHIRCPSTVFPIAHKAHLSPLGDDASAVLSLTRQLIKHCDDTSTPWSLECRERSLFWQDEWASSLPSLTVNMCQFGHTHRSPVRLATRHPDAFRHLAIPCQHVHVSTATTTNRVPPEVVAAFYDAVGTAILGFLRFPPLAPGPTPLHLAQVAAGLQPRRSHLCLVPEFKCIANVRLPELPPLQDGKLKHELVVGDVCVPAGSKHLLPGSQRGKDGQGASAAVGGSDSPFCGPSLPHPKLTTASTSAAHSFSPKLSKLSMVTSSETGRPNPQKVSAASCVDTNQDVFEGWPRSKCSSGGI